MGPFILPTRMDIFCKRRLVFFSALTVINEELMLFFPHWTLWWGILFLEQRCYLGYLRTCHWSVDSSQGPMRCLNYLLLFFDSRDKQKSRVSNVIHSNNGTRWWKLKNTLFFELFCLIPSESSCALSVVLFHHRFGFPAFGTLLSDINICNSNQLSCNFNKGVRKEKVLVG